MVRLILVQGLRLAALGVALGLVAAAVTTRVLASLLFEIRPMDPPTFLGVGIGLLAVGALASLVPARRATGLDPMTALRHE